MDGPTEPGPKEKTISVKTILSASVKGGVGKTTVAVGVAQALQRKGFQVGILDLDYRAPCVPIVLNIEDGVLGRTENDAMVPVQVEGLHVFSMAFIWPASKCVQVEDNDATDDVRQLLAPGVIAWPNLDYLVLDSPPTSSGIVRVALERSEAAGALIVSHPSRVSRADTVRTLDLFAEKQVPVFGLISNQGIDEHGQDRFDLQDQDIIDLAARYSLPWCFCIPHTRDLNPHFDGLAASILSTQPVLLAKPQEPKGVAWDKLITLAQQLKPSAKS
jgi:ATP-binding protein involved in chromosome partitioning